MNVYPNPFTDEIEIRLKVRDAQNVEIFISDLLGNELDKIKEGTLLQGEYKFNYGSDTLPAGAYFIIVRSAGMAKAIPILKTY